MGLDIAKVFDTLKDLDVERRLELVREKISNNILNVERHLDLVHEDISDKILNVEHHLEVVHEISDRMGRSILS
jgi:hypothetical protein